MFGLLTVQIIVLQVNNNMKKVIPTGRQGFTLVELIVVITIIAVLTAVGVISYSGVMKKSRDSRRMADLEKYRVALEMARQVGSTYPDDSPGLTTLVTMGLIPVILSDPKVGFVYKYVQPTNYTYNLYAQMEDPGSMSSGNPFQFDCGGGVGTCNYEVKNP